MADLVAILDKREENALMAKRQAALAPEAGRTFVLFKLNTTLALSENCVRQAEQANRRKIV